MNPFLMVALICVLCIVLTNIANNVPVGILFVSAGVPLFLQIGVNPIIFWIKRMPRIQRTIVISRPDPDGEPEFDDYCWGFSLPADLSYGENERVPSSAEYIPSFKSVYTVFQAGGKEIFLDSIRSQVIEPIRAQGHTILPGQPVGNLFVRVHENGNMVHYFEVWVPIA